VIAPSLRIAPAAVLAVVVLLVRNVTAAARLATLRVHAPRHPEEEEVQEAMAVVGEEEEEEEEEATAPLVVVVAVKKLGARWLYLVASPLADNTLFRLFFQKLHVRRGRSSVA